jgi:hypothetical protein
MQIGELQLGATDIPVPEPSSLALSSILIGLFAMIGLRKRLRESDA